MKKRFQLGGLLFSMAILLQMSGCATMQESKISALVAAQTDTLYIDQGHLCSTVCKSSTWADRLVTLLVGPSDAVKLGRPTDVCVDDAGRIFVCDGDLSQVLSLDPVGGAFSQTFGDPVCGAFS